MEVTLAPAALEVEARTPLIQSSAQIRHVMVLMRTSPNDMMRNEFSARPELYCISATVYVVSMATSTALTDLQLVRPLVDALYSR